MVAAGLVMWEGQRGCICYFENRHSTYTIQRNTSHQYKSHPG